MAKGTKLPRDVQMQCMWIVRGYERNRRDYIQRRRDIIDSGGAHWTDVKVNGETQRVYLPGTHNASRTTEDKQMQLEGLEHTQAYRQMRAVEHARDRIGDGLPEMIRDKLRDGIMINCCYGGRRYPYEHLAVVGMSRAQFYRCRESFFLDIATELGLIG